MDKGDHVIRTKAGELRVLPESARRQSGDEGDDTLIGTVVDVREPEQDSIIALRTAESNVAPPFATLADVRAQYQYREAPGEA